MTRRIAIALTALAALLALPAVAAADEAEPLFDPGAVAEIDFTLPPASLQKLTEEPETDEYQHAEITVKAAGTTYTLADVGFRLKGGHGSFRELDGKAAFKVKFKEFGGSKFLGLKKLTLNNMVQDPSMVHETMAYELFRALGVPAPRTGYAFVRVNGDPYGVYLNVETPDDVMLENWFATTQHLYEADDPGVDVRTDEAETFEVDEGDKEDFSDLEALIEAVNVETGDWSDNVGPVADLNEMTRAWAVERYVAHWDGYAGTAAPFRPNNYYLHSDEAGVFQTLPWGTDQTWEPGREVEFDEQAGGLMFNKCLAGASCRQLYLGGLSEVRCAALESDDAARAAKLAAMLAPYQDDEDEARRESTPVEIAAELEAVEAFATDRPAELEDFLVAEGVFGDGDDPCVKPKEPEKPVVTPTPTPPPGPTPPAPPPLEIGASKLKGRIVFTRVATPAAGTVAQKVTAKIGGHRVRACADSKPASGAAVVKVHCRLSKAAQEARADGPLKLRVRVGFAPAGGAKATFRTRVLNAPKRG
jgi:hypothetical protein